MVAMLVVGVVVVVVVLEVVIAAWKSLTKNISIKKHESSNHVIQKENEGPYFVLFTLGTPILPSLLQLTLLQ